MICHRREVLVTVKVSRSVQRSVLDNPNGLFGSRTPRTVALSLKKILTQAGVADSVVGMTSRSNKNLPSHHTSHYWRSGWSHWCDEEGL